MQRHRAVSTPSPSSVKGRKTVLFRDKSKDIKTFEQNLNIFGYYKRLMCGVFLIVRQKYWEVLVRLLEVVTVY